MEIKPMNNTKRLIGSRINSALSLRRMKQKELARVLGVTDNTVSYYVSGAKTPNAEQIIAIANALDVSADYLLGISKTKSETLIASEVTGLSYESVSYLLAIKTEDSDLLDILDRALKYHREKIEWR